MSDTEKARHPKMREEREDMPDKVRPPERKKLLKRVALITALPLVAFSLYQLIAPSRASLGMRAASQFIRLSGKPLADPAAFNAKVQSRQYPSPAPVPKTMRAIYKISETQLGGHKVISVAPKVGQARWTIIYYHGGAYVNDLAKPHWDIVAALANATGATIIVPIYPLAPEFDHRTAFVFLDQVYRSALAKAAPESIILAGDSAGGGLALAQAINNRSNKLPQPARIIMFSPWLDLTLSDAEARDVEPHDIMLGIDALRLCGKWWAGDADPKSPNLSPLYADLTDLPPMSLYQGTSDVLVVDSRNFAASAKRAGVDITYAEYPDAFHVFVGATFTSEAKDVFAKIGAMLQQSSGEAS
jgi:epsilon-lactone hydrolase